MAKERIRATTPVRRNGKKETDVRAVVPAVVREKLGACVGDELVFEEGNMHSVENAMTKPGGYFVVYRKSTPAPPSALLQEPAERKVAQLEPLASVVNSKLRDRR